MFVTFLCRSRTTSFLGSEGFAVLSRLCFCRLRDETKLF